MKQIFKDLKKIRIFPRRRKPWEKTSEELDAIINKDSNLTKTENSLTKSQENSLTSKEEIENKIKLFDPETQALVRKYKIYEDSIAETVNRIKEEVPEISGHIEFRKWVDTVIEQDKQTEVLNKSNIVILRKKNDILFQNKIDEHHLFKYQDRNYEVDIKHEQTKDLFEKQRVRDTFIEEKKDQLNYLIGFYENRYKYLQYNKYKYQVYENNYKMSKLSIILAKRLVFTSVMSTFFYLANPLLLVALIPEYYGILYSFNLLRSVVENITLSETKQAVSINRFNFLGLRKENKFKEYFIKKLVFLGKIENNVINLNDKGFSFTVKLLKNFLNPKKSDEKKEETKDNFERFYVFMIDSICYRIPCDLTSQDPSTNEELTLLILNNEIDKVLAYDYSNYEDSYSELYNKLMNYLKEKAKKSHKMFVTPEERLKRIYQDFHPNRDYNDANYFDTLKRPDDINGEYIDNGYR